MKKFSLFVLLTVIIACSYARQQEPAPPATQLKIKEKSGFLGMGGPKVIEIQLSNQNHQLPLTSDNVNSAQYYYFLCKPVEDWKIDADFVKDDLSRLTIYQNEQKLPIVWKSDVISDAKSTSILLGFPKTVKLYQLFLFQCPVGDGMGQAEFKVPQEFWPGYSTLGDWLGEADRLMAAKQYKEAIAVYERILQNPLLQIFPKFSEVKDKRTKVFDAFLADNGSAYQNIVANAQSDLKEKIAKLEQLRPAVLFVVDSLAKPSMNIGPLDPSSSPIINKARDIVIQVTTARDSLQRVLDDKTIRWILEGSATGKNGVLYQYIVEALAWGLSSLDFADTNVNVLNVKIPDDVQSKLTKYSLNESFETFIRECNDRFQTHLPMLPIEFLPSLRKDTASFPLPYYSMLKAANDYFYGNFLTTRDEILKVFRTCYEPELLTRFDQMRVMIGIRQGIISPDALKLIGDGEEAEKRRDYQTAKDKYEQARIVAPNFPYASFVLGRYYARTGDMIRAITFFQNAYQQDSVYLSAYRECYNLYKKQGNFKPTIEVLTYALQKGNDCWEVNSNLGYSYNGDGDIAKAIQHYERALSINPKSYQTNIQLGLAYQNMKSFPKAREYFNRALNLDPQRQDAVDCLAKLLELERGAR